MCNIEFFNYHDNPNNIFNNINGEYVAFIESNGLFDSDNALEIMYDLAIKNDADMVSANVRYFDDFEFNDNIRHFYRNSFLSSSDYGIPWIIYKNIFKKSFLVNFNFNFYNFGYNKDSLVLTQILTNVKRFFSVPIYYYKSRFNYKEELLKIDTFEKKLNYIEQFKHVLSLLYLSNFNNAFDLYFQRFLDFLNLCGDDEVNFIVNKMFNEDIPFPIELKSFKNITYSSRLNKKISNEINELETNINNLSFENKLLTDENNILKNRIKLIDDLKWNNQKLLNHYNHMINVNNKLRHENHALENLYEKFLSNNSINFSKNILNFYKGGYELYRDEYYDLLEKFEYYDNLFAEIFTNNLYDIDEKNKDCCLSIKKLKCQDSKFKARNLNIAYVLHAFPTLSETFILNELKWLKKNNYNVKVFCYDDPVKPVELDFDLEVIRFDGDLYNNLEKLLIDHKIDLIHTHFVYPTGTLYTYPLAEKLKIPFTIFAHAYDIFIKENDARNKVSEIASSNYCLGIFTLSNYHKNYLLKRNVPIDKIFLTRQATEYEIFPLSLKSNNIRKIVSISRFVEKKGLDTLIETANLLKDEDFVFYIYGFGRLENSLRRRINELGLKNIFIKGALNNPSEVRKVFNESDLLISPCKIAQNGDRDGIPTVIFESMAIGLPVLTTRVSAIPEVIKDGINGFIVDPDNPKMLAEKIIDINHLSYDELFDIVENAQNDVQNISSIDKTMDTLLNIWGNSIY